MRRAAPILVAAAVAALAASPVGAESSATKVSVRLFEFKVTSAPAKAKRGAVTFVVRNTGKIDHELVVLRTNIAPAKLAVRSGKAVETGRVGRAGRLSPGTSRTLSLKLKAGRYVLLCNLPGHYQAGQRIAFRAT
ncbi:MAG TPA: hypothetical protein VK926_10105 [Gaiellaceae bacterium]|nr:hypothetical protein [Gaiellaceae bacterium]